MHGTHTKSHVISFSLPNEDYERAVKSLERSTKGFNSVHEYARYTFLYYLKPKAEYMQEWKRAIKSTEKVVVVNQCLRCGYKWKPRTVETRRKQCPVCNSRKWDKPEDKNEQSI